jgi:hypothetical protein
LLLPLRLKSLREIDETRRKQYEDESRFLTDE